MSHKVINKHRDQVRPGDVWIMRPGKWGNPFVIGKDGDRKEVLEKYESWLLKQPALIAKMRRELGPVLHKGGRLVCCCHPLPCHGHIMVKAIEGTQT